MICNAPVFLSCFNSRPSCDGRLPRLRRAIRPYVFQFTPVVRRATSSKIGPISSTCFNSRPSCDGRHRSNGGGGCGGVSIHARRATGDCAILLAIARAPCFNSRPSCDGRPQCSPIKHFHERFNSRPSCDGRPSSMSRRYTRWLFQFTPVVRRATVGDSLGSRATRFQFTPVVRRATEIARSNIITQEGFNSRPSCDGRPYSSISSLFA